MSLKQATLLVHTSNRPQFVGRMLDALQNSCDGDAPQIVILDASDDTRYDQTTEILDGKQYSFVIQRFRTDRELPLQHRLAQALPNVRTPYVALTADDDFFQPAALCQAIDYLDRHEDTAVVYGHTLHFLLSEYVPYAPFDRAYVHARRNPPIRWMDDPTLLQRFEQLDRNRDEASAIGWYALQRCSVLADTTRLAFETNASNAMFEYLQIFVQTSAGKAHFLDAIFLARQDNPAQRHLIENASAIDAQLRNLEASCAAFLVGMGEPSHQAAVISRRYWEGVRQFVRTGSRRSWKSRIADRLSYLRRVRAALVGIPADQSGSAGDAYSDPRLPVMPDLAAHADVISAIQRASQPRFKD